MMATIDTIGFDDAVIEVTLAGRVFNISIDPSVEAYWKLVNATQKTENTLGGTRRIKNYIIDFILDSHYSCRFWKVGKIFTKIYLRKNIGFLSLDNFLTQYFKILKERGLLKNLQSPQAKKK